MALPNMGDQFRGLPMGDLIGGPLMASCDAQVRLANATANFIKQIGFMPPTSEGQETGEVRYVSFKYDRPVDGAPVGEDGKMPTETVELSVPMLAIVKVPTLSIEKVDITFDMEVKNSETAKDSVAAQASMAAEVKFGWGPVSGTVKISGSVSTNKENTRSSDQSAKYHVAVLATDKGMPEGLARVLDMMAQSIAPKQVTKQAA